MNDLTSFPSPLRRFSSAALRGSLWLLAVLALLFVLAWGVLHALIVPRISELRPELEAWTSRQLGVPVRIAAVQARSGGMVPSFELSGVQLFDPAGRPALSLPRVLVALSPRSLLNLGFEQLYVDRPELEIRRARDGKITVAGLDFSRSPNTDDSAAADWVFSQIEFVVKDGSVRWTDELRGQPMLALEQVNLVLRNGRLQHSLRLDATPPPEWGERFTLMGTFRQPLLSTRNGNWREWDGQAYVDASRVDVSQLRRYADLGVDVARGKGALRAWVDVAHGSVSGASADLGLNEVSVTLGKGLQPLDLRSLAGRLELRLNGKGGGEFSTRGLQFDTSDGVHWPGGNARVVYQLDPNGAPQRTELWADKLDLAALSQITNRLPVGTRAHAALTAYAPKGLVERIHASWEGQPDAKLKFAAQGRITQLAIAAQPVPNAERLRPEERMGTPGVRNANIEFDLTEAGGHASVSMQNGALDFPGVFEDPVLPFASIAMEAQWKVDGQAISVRVPSLKFANDDAQGEAQADWKTMDGSGKHRLPGFLDLQGTLSRGDGTRVHRYLPLVLPQDVRDYLRDAVTSGVASNVKFKLKGDLYDMPFPDPRQGEFRVTANVQNVNYSYVPRSLQGANDLPWPALTQLSGEFLMDRIQLQVKNAHGRIAGSGVQLAKADASIPDVRHSVVAVAADAKGPLGELLGLLAGSPVDGMINKVLTRASATGSADYKLRLNLPIANLDKSTVQGSVLLNNNDVQIRPDTPRMQRARGNVNFSETGFAIVGGQARALGGDVRIEGGLAGGTTLIKLQGSATADGLRQARELGLVAKLAQRASGSAAYTGTLGFPRGELELTVVSNLQGMALTLPAPLNKAADAQLPLKVEKLLLKESLQPLPNGTLRLHDQVQVELGKLAAASYVRDLSGPEAKVLRGNLRLGAPAMEEPANLPDDGVSANLALGTVNLDAWTVVANELSGGAAGALAAPASAPLPSPAVVPLARALPAPEVNTALPYIPTSVVLRARELSWGGRKFNNILAGGSREGLTWRANLQAQELDGYAEYRLPAGANPGRVYLRLARAVLSASSEAEVENLLDEQPASIPALDIVVDDFEFSGKKLGRIEVDAVNRGAGAAAREGASPREWRLSKFNISTPEAQFTASGNWAMVNAQSQPGGRGGERRRTVLNFKLDIADAGGLLGRFGMKDVVRRGKGAMEGQVSWLGSPFTPDYPSMGGNFNVKVESGQFLKTDPGLAKLLGVLSLQSLPRRLTLDFKDVFSDGFAFDFFGGDVAIEQGIAKTNNLQMKGVNAAVFMDGRADIAKETQDIKVVVIPEINAGTGSLIATWINPAVGVTTFLAQLFLRRPLIEANTQEFHIDGSWADPKIVKVDHKPVSTDTKLGAAQ